MIFFKKKIKYQLYIVPTSKTPNDLRTAPETTIDANNNLSKKRLKVFGSVLKIKA